MTSTGGIIKSDSARPLVGVIGTGMMGAPLVAAFAAAFPTFAFDSDSEKRDAAVAAATSQPGVLDCRGVDGVKDLAECDVIVLMLPNSDIVELALVQSGLLDILPSNRLVIDMGSSIPQRTRDLARDLAERGIGMVDAPVSGGVARARSRQLTAIVGGTDEAVVRATPVLETVASSIFHVGGIGTGHAAKALNNLLSACGLLISAEAVEAASRSGIDPKVMLNILNSSTGRNHASETKIAQYVLSGTYDSGFAAQLMLKDLRIAAGIFDETQTPGGLATSVLSTWEGLADQLSAGADQTEIARIIAG